MSKVNCISSTICLNSIKGRVSGQEGKIEVRMIDLTSCNKNKKASWTDSHICRNKAIKFLQLQEWLLLQEDTFLVNKEH